MTPEPLPHAPAPPRVAAPSAHQHPPSAPAAQFVPPPHQYPAAHTPMGSPSATAMTPATPPLPTPPLPTPPAPIPAAASAAQHHPVPLASTPPVNPITSIPPPSLSPALPTGWQDTEARSSSPCPYMADARCFFTHLKTQFKVIKQASHYFEPKFDKCYCSRCYNADQPDVLDPDGPGECIPIYECM